MKAIVPTLLAILLLSNLASATFITGEIRINELGDTTFDAQTDVQVEIEDITFRNNELFGKTSSLTSKHGSVWTLNLNLVEYDSILLDISLPSNLDSITSIEGNANIISTQDHTISIIDQGALNFEVSYTLKEKENFAWMIWIILIAILFLAYHLYQKHKKKKNRYDSIKSLIGDNEEKIIDLLVKSNSPLRQKDLRKQLGIPKASFTRYIINLEKKKLVVREGEGKNKIVKLK